MPLIRAITSGIVIPTNPQTGVSYTLALLDAESRVTTNNAAANTVTIPLNSTVPFAVNTVIVIRQIGVGLSSLVAASGVTLNAPNNTTLDLAGQHAEVYLRYDGSNVWDVTGQFRVTDQVVGNPAGTRQEQTSTTTTYTNGTTVISAVTAALTGVTELIGSLPASRLIRSIIAKRNLFVGRIKPSFILALTTPYTLDDVNNNGNIVQADSSGGAMSIVIPSTYGTDPVSGFATVEHLTINNMDSSGGSGAAVTITATGTTINGAANFVLPMANMSAELYFDDDNGEYKTL